MTTSTARKGYATAQRIRGRKGQAIRARHLADHPLCVTCAAKGRVREAAVVDHVHALTNGGPESADHNENRQALCKQCHAEKTAADLGYKMKPRIGLDGYPIYAKG